MQHTLLPCPDGSRRAEPRHLATSADFAYPPCDPAAADAFLDRLEAELAPRIVRAANPSPAVDYTKQPQGELVARYGQLLRSGQTAQADQYRAAVMAAFARTSGTNREHVGQWLTQAGLFVRHSDELRSRVAERADEKTLPFAKAEVERHIDQGLEMIRAEFGSVQPYATVDTVLRKAQAERQRRIAEIDRFYRRAMAGGPIKGVPFGRNRNTAWLSEGRFIFEDLDTALAMAPRPAFQRYVGFWPTSSRKIKDIGYGPPNFHGARPESIEYVDANHVFRFWSLSESNIKEIVVDADPDHDHEKDRYHTGGSWKKYPQPTTTELEISKATWCARLMDAARHGFDNG